MSFIVLIVVIRNIKRYLDTTRLENYIINRKNNDFILIFKIIHNISSICFYI